MVSMTTKLRLILTGLLTMLLATLLLAPIPGGASSAASVDPGRPDLYPPPVLRLTDSAYPTMHDSKTLCEGRRVRVDGPVRVFEDADHRLHMTVTGPDGVSFQWTGSPGAFANRTAKLDCIPVQLGYTRNADPAAFDQKSFIQALHYRAGDVTAYTHQDYYGKRTAEPGCDPLDQQHECWYSSVGAWGSAGAGHLSFSHKGNAIYPHVPYPGHAATPAAGWLGYGTPSNIFRSRTLTGELDGYWYMLTRASVSHAGQSAGSCLWRTTDPSDIGFWRAWDTGTETFEQPSRDPYAGQNAPCDVITGLGGAYVRSVAWHRPSRHYVAAWRTPKAVVYSTSVDLITWNTPKTLLTSTWEQANYPTVVDLSGGDWGDDNFDRLYSAGSTWMFYRKDLPDWGHHRLVQRRIEVANYLPDTPGSGNRG
jgi:hypothetical protein